MKTRILLSALAFLLLGQDCETPPGPPPNDYCAGAVEGTWAAGFTEYVPRRVDELTTIIGGEMSTDRRSTVKVNFGQSYCTGVILGDHTVLVAAHCGYADTTIHYIEIDENTIVQESGHLVHPDYWGYVNKTDYSGRESDLMLIYTTATLPDPFPVGSYSSKAASLCESLIAQGYGKDEFEETGPLLRESLYMVTKEEEKVIRTKQRTWGGVCFGDSGGPLYADLKGQPYLQLAGITSTTNNPNCLEGSTHVKVAYFWPWIIKNFNGPS